MSVAVHSAVGIVRALGFGRILMRQRNVYRNDLMEHISDGGPCRKLSYIAQGEIVPVDM